MIINGKLFIPPSRDGSDIKELFKHLASAGAGRPIGPDGFSQGPWTPELLVDAITDIDTNHVGIDLRTVQFWFQENDKGISRANLRWLARVFGCDDPEATSAWQIELIAAQSRLTAKRRNDKLPAHETKEASAATFIVPQSPITQSLNVSKPINSKRRYRLADMSASLFSSGSSLNLPAMVFAGFSALGLLSYLINIHNVTFTRADGIEKQVGFLWTANWTFVFMVFLPLFFATVTELITYWAQEGRPNVITLHPISKQAETWANHIRSSSSSYWAVFILCVVFAGIIQWISVCLVSLIKGGGNYAPDWSTIAILRPNIVSVSELIVFTSVAYLYMALCFYLFFAGLILLYSLVQDFAKHSKALFPNPLPVTKQVISSVMARIIVGIWRCTILGLMVAIVMKLQSSYLTSNAENILRWLVNDLKSVIYPSHYVNERFRYPMPTQFTSFLIALSSCFVFFFALFVLRFARSCNRSLFIMVTAILFLCSSYLLIDQFVGFSILLGFSVLITMYGLFTTAQFVPVLPNLENIQHVS